MSSFRIKYWRSKELAKFGPFEEVEVEPRSRFNNSMISGACNAGLHPCTSRGECACWCHTRVTNTLDLFVGPTSGTETSFIVLSDTTSGSTSS